MTFRFIYHFCLRCISIVLLMHMASMVQAQIHVPENNQKNYYIKRIFFGGGSYQIDLDQRQELIDFILDIEDLREDEIELHGHTDNIGSIEFNQWLSEMRSAEVLDIISELELDKNGIQIHDFGEESPYYDNKTWAGKLSNRRVDVIIKRIVM